MADEYERDEFDEIAEAGGPVGVHRAPRPWWTVVVTPLIVFVVAGLVAYVVAQVLWNSEVNSADPSPTATTTIESTATPEPSDSATAEATETAEPEPSETASETAEPEPTFEVDLDTAVSVLNGTGVQGLAGERAQSLTDAGFTAVNAANLSGDRPDANRVIYSEEDQVATAEEVAATLGIDTVELGTPTADAPIEVQIVDAG